MLTSITLQNFKSFGREVTVPLEPITAIVGPNNSGKSSFMSAARFVQNALVGGVEAAVQTEGGLSFVVHRPPVGDGQVVIGWASGGATFRGEYRAPAEHLVGSDVVDWGHGPSAWDVNHRMYVRNAKGDITNTAPPALESLRRFWAEKPKDRVVAPIATASLVKLSLDALRADAPVVADAKLALDGSGLAAVLGLWRGSEPTRAAELDAFLSTCIPEIQHALVKPSPSPGSQRLWFQQKDGEQFDATHASDGLLAFTALAMHIVAAGKGAVFFIEEPEQSIHPRRLRHLVELMRKAVVERGCQFVLATHSPVLLNELKDQPERIMLFRRGAEGTEVTRCTDVPPVVEALETSSPGELLETAFFEGLWGSTGD